MNQESNQEPDKEPEQTPVFAPWMKDARSDWLLWVALVLGVAVIVLVIMGAGTIRIAVIAAALLFGLFRIYYASGRK